MLPASFANEQQSGRVIRFAGEYLVMRRITLRSLPKTQSHLPNPPRSLSSLWLLAALALIATVPACHAQQAPPPVPVATPANTPDDPGKWAFDPPTDRFSPDAVLDLRSLNEKVAGQSGFVRRTPDGSGFELGNGKPVRFWAVDEFIENTADQATIRHKLRWLAKRGVNMVRDHAELWPKKPGSQVTDVDHDEIDHIWKLVAAAKAEGIYTTISPYWAVPVKIQDSWGVPGGSGQSALSLLFFDPTLQKGYKAWLRALYAPPNPYTGIPLAKDPSVAIIQLQNEDSLLFWTTQDVHGPELTQLETLYGSWLAKKYGSLDAANSAWGGDHPPASAFQDKIGDDFGNGRAAIYIIWDFTQSPAVQPPYQQKRLADQLEFFSDTMSHLNSEMIDYLRNDLGCKQLINPGNWRPADPVKLFDAERYSYMPGDVMAVNRYFTGEHVGRDKAWAIEPHDKFTNASALLTPQSLPINIKQPVGYPFIIPETAWVSPTAYQSEGPFLAAAYESLTGVALSYFFSDGDVPEWQQPFLYSYGGWSPEAKWSVATPVQLGQFPAAALIYRLGYVKKGPVAVDEERSLADIWDRKSSLIAEEGGYDPNRDAGDLPPTSAVHTGLDPLAFLVGPVEVKIGGDPAKSKVIQLSRYIDNNRKLVVSDTGEIRLNYGSGVCVVNTPCAQGAAGFLGGESPINLSDIGIQTTNDYATISVVSLDGKSIRSSRKLLVQVGTIARPTGWVDQDATWQSADGKQTFTGKEVVLSGHNPWQVENISATITVKNPGLTSATLLDANFMPVRKADAKRSAGGLTVELPSDTMYLILR